MSLVWREQLSVGNDVIDSDHRHLIEIINQAEINFKTRELKELASTLDELSQYSKVHFAREEKIATAIGYTQAPHLHDSHDALLKQLEQMRGEMDALDQEWSPQTADHFTHFLRNWLVDHVIKEDLLMKPILQKHSPRLDPR